MNLPASVLLCMDRLEQAGFQAWAVGGCVRDHLLGLAPQDFDLCTDAAPAQMRRVFSDRQLVLAGEKHGTVGVILEGRCVEITAFRTEGGYSDSRHPGWVAFVPRLEEDLARRDFTVNAMAYSPTRGLRDPFGGRQDLEMGVLRAVGDPATRFTEDALRILRGVRFALRYGLTPEPRTKSAMLSLAPRLEMLARERVFSELCKLLPLASARGLLEFFPVLAAAVPELAPCRGFDQHSPHHAYDVLTHTAHVVAAVPPEPVLRWAALLHDIAKPQVFYRDETGRGHFPGHAQAGAQVADGILQRLKAPTALRTQVAALIEHHMLPLEPEEKLLRRRLSKYGREFLLQLLTLQEADRGGKGTGADGPGQFAQVRAALEDLAAREDRLTLRTLAVNGRDLLALGYAPGPQLGQALQALLEQVLSGGLPNEKDALLAFAEGLRN